MTGIFDSQRPDVCIGDFKCATAAYSKVSDVAMFDVVGRQATCYQ